MRRREGFGGYFHTGGARLSLWHRVYRGGGSTGGISVVKISQFSIASGNWQKVVRGVRSVDCDGVTEDDGVAEGDVGCVGRWAVVMLLVSMLI